MIDTGKLLMVVGGVIAVLGVVIWALGRAGFRGLPGDISYQGQNVRVYFPIVSCILLSVLLTLGMWLWRWLSGR
ncbi:MAG TPA: DUF2905 domain-containing protein [Tepidisphaeraceae bacterium]|nr:DUF2905 domain-containing protein [Tepidisphaeraceae bacterium]